MATIEIAGNMTLKLNGQRKEIKPQQNSEIYDTEAVTAINLMKKATEYWTQICNGFLRNC